MNIQPAKTFVAQNRNKLYRKIDNTTLIQSIQIDEIN